MRDETLCLLALVLGVLCCGSTGRSAQWLLTFQLVPGMDLSKLTRSNGVFMDMAST